VAGREARALMRWLVDAMNVIGSRPDGWWRDRDGAARRLLGDLERFAETTGDDVTVVLDAAPRELAGRRGPLEVVIAPTRGRDAADDEIARRLAADPDAAAVTVVTSDADLARRAREHGAAVEGAGGFRARL
jgi:predicted RNA-binding protein with PIN domain